MIPTNNATYKIKYAMRHPLLTVSYVLEGLIPRSLPKEEESVRSSLFFKEYEPKVLFNKLNKYWERYRFFNEIKQIIGANEESWKQKNILDVGCNYSSVLNILPKMNGYGIDIVINGLKKHGFRLNPAYKWIQGVAERLPFDDGFFDVVFTTNGIDHYENPDKAFKEMLRVLKPKGFLVMTVDVFDKDIGYRNKEHPHSFTEQKAKELFKRNNVKIVLERHSPVNAQFWRYVIDGGRVVRNKGKHELILVGIKQK